MRRIMVLAVVAGLVVSVAPVGHSQKQALQLVRVQVTSESQANDLMTNYDETHNHSSQTIEILAWPGDIARLEASGYRYQIVEDDVFARDQALFAQAPQIPVALPGPNRDNYRVLADYNAEMKKLAKKHPSLVRHFKAPYKTLEGREVFGIEIAAGVKSTDGRPTFYVDGVHHAREWPAGEYPMIFAHYLVEGFGKNKEITKVLKNERIVIVPIVNPDGFDYSRSSPLAQQPNVDAAHGVGCSAAGCEGYWRKNRRSFTGATVPGVQKNPDAYGVDPNRNYSWLWGGPGASPNETSQTHYGELPFSEPESRNVQKIVLARNVTSIVSNHTYSRLVLRPWGDTFIPSPDAKYLTQLGAKMAKAMGGYQNIPGRQLYATTGTMSDWGYGTLHVPSYTFEHGRAFHPPYTGCEEDCVEKDWKGVMEAFMYGAKAGLDSDVHGVLKGDVVGAKGPAKLTIVQKKTTPLSPGNPIGKKSYTETFKTTMTTSKKGSFTWHLPPSTRPFLTKVKVEKYTLSISSKGGNKAMSFPLKPGQSLNLGKIKV